MSGLQVQHRAALVEGAAAAAGRELHDDVGADPADAVLEGGEPLGIARRRLVLVADMDVDERGAGLVGLVRALDLLGDRDRHGGVVGFLRGTEPVMATAMMAGSRMGCLRRLRVAGNRAAPR
jgi:hypothetical protein